MKNFESNNKSIAFNILYILYNIEEIIHANKSKNILKLENQAILLMITDGEKWHYLAVKILATLFGSITETFYVWTVFIHIVQKTNLKKHKSICKNHDCCYIEMPKEENILEYNHGEKSMRVPFII